MDEAYSPVCKPALTSSQFDGFLGRLDPDRDCAGEKYENIRRKLIKFFEWNSCFPAEDLADETIDRVTQKLKDQNIQDVVAFAWGVAKNIRKEAQKRAGRNVDFAELPEKGAFSGRVETTEDRINSRIQNERRLNLLQRCIQRLSEVDRELFLAYYDSRGDDSPRDRQKLASSLRLTVGALRVRINRLRYKLERCVKNSATDH
jgi:DNA-directed RNA polymerase specialized sigma24 family protein